MKYFTAFLCIWLVSCTDTGVQVNDQTAASTAGAISFSLSKSALPIDITSLTFTVSNYSTNETIRKVVPVSADTTIRVAFERLSAGTWHVSVVAEDSLSGRQYAGEADANVNEAQTTELNLFLELISPGLGSLIITVNWQTSALFADYEHNPILEKRGLWYDVRGIGYPSLLHDDGKYKMWFMNYGLMSIDWMNYAPYATIGLAESADGTTWTRVADTVMTPSPHGWDRTVIVAGTILKENGVYTMYYTGAVASGVDYNIGMAESQDGLHWTKDPHPLFPDGSNVGVVGVIKAKGQYLMYYHTGPSSSIYLATSVNGKSWQPYAGNPVLVGDAAWEFGRVVYASVIFEDNAFTMLYANDRTSQSFGLATSTDGIHWVKDARNPVFSKMNTVNNWSTYAIGYPYLFRIGNELRMYYTGFTNGGIERIGYAVKK